MSSAMARARDDARAAGRRAGWLRLLHRWHWISSAACLVGLLGFAITGVTLNHADAVDAQPVVTSRQLVLPPPLAAAVGPAAAAASGPLPARVRDWIAEHADHAVSAGAAEWSADEVYLAMPRPGGDAWVRIARDDGAVELEDTRRGAVAYLNDLHKGRHAGPAWRLFIDVFAVACLVFSVTGLLILQAHAAQRPSTWPLVGAGLVLPVLLALLLVH